MSPLLQLQQTIHFSLFLSKALRRLDPLFYKSLKIFVLTSHPDYNNSRYPAPSLAS